MGGHNQSATQMNYFVNTAVLLLVDFNRLALTHTSFYISHLIEMMNCPFNLTCIFLKCFQLFDNFSLTARHIPILSTAIISREI